MAPGSLTIVGTGIQFVGQVTLEARAWIEQADKVLFGVTDPLTARWLRTLNATAVPLPYPTHYARRRETYRLIVSCIMAEVRREQMVCAVFYGHPGVFTEPAHAALRQAQSEGYTARMLPGISAEDCLFADLGLDPATYGCQNFEATDFLIRRRIFDPRSALILWQIAVIGNLGFYEEGSHRHGLTVLAEVLEDYYGSDHIVVIYEAAIYPTVKPHIQHVPLCMLPQARISLVSTLYVPPKELANVDEEMMQRLRMNNQR